MEYVSENQQTDKPTMPTVITRRAGAKPRERWSPGAEVVPQLRPRVQERRQRLFTYEELKNLPPPEWLAPGIPKGQTTIYGPPGEGKTFLALNLALALQSQGKPVVYIAGEGMRGVPRRLNTWVEHYEQPGLPSFFLWNGALSMLNKKEVEKFINEAMGLVVEKTGRLPELVVIDTLARCFVGGDENSAEDMNTFVSHCDMMQNEMGCSVFILHHTGKDTSRGARGSTALLGADDCQIKVSKKGKIITARVMKLKDADDNVPELYFQMVPVADSVVLIETTTPVTSTTRRPPSAKTMEGVERMVEALKEVGVMSWRDLLTASRLPESSFKRRLDAALCEGLIEKGDDGRYWSPAVH